MTEPTWVQEMRIVRGIPKRDEVVVIARKAWDRYKGWHPDPDTYVKIVATCAILSLVVYAYAAHRAQAVSHG